MHTVRRWLLLLLLVAASLIGYDIQAAPDDVDFVNLSVTRTPRTKEVEVWRFTVTNESSIPVTDIVVDISFRAWHFGQVAAQFGTVRRSVQDEPEPGETFSVAGTGIGQRGIWTIPRLAAGAIAQITLGTTGYFFLPTDNSYFRATATLVSSAPADQYHGDNQAHDWNYQAPTPPGDNCRGNPRVAPQTIYEIEVEADPPAVLPGGAVTFEVAVRAELGVRYHKYHARNLEVALSLQGLSYVSPPVATAPNAFDADRQVWTFDRVGRYPDENVECRNEILTERFSFTARVDDAPGETPCLTAEIIDSIPSEVPGTSDDNKATACVVKPKLVIDDGHIHLFSSVPEPCGDAGPDCKGGERLKLLIDTGSDLGMGPRSSPVYLAPESVILHVQDPGGRHKGMWKTPAARGAIDGNFNHQVSVMSAATGPTIRDRYAVGTPRYNAYYFAIADVIPKVRPGMLTIIRGNAGTFTVLALDGRLETGPISTTNPLNEYSANIIQFDTLGTYQFKRTIGHTRSGNVHRASGIYTIHVGPITDLGVRGRQSNHAEPDELAYTIEAVNHYKVDQDHVRVRLSGVPESSRVSQIATRGSYRHTSCTGGVCEGLWTIGMMKRPEVVEVAGQAPARLTLFAPAGTTQSITATIGVSQDYSICIDNESNDIPGGDASESVCTGMGGAWHATPYYDYVDDNNTAVIAPMPGAGWAGEESGQPNFSRVEVGQSGDHARLEWTNVHEVWGWHLDYYELQWSLDGLTGWKFITDVHGRTARIGWERYVDFEVTPGLPRYYRVRAVNLQDGRGPWSLVRSHGLASRPTVPTRGVALSPSAVSVAEQQGTTTYTVALKGKPTGPVTVTASVDDHEAAQVHASGGSAAKTATLNFTPDDWDQPQTLTVTGVDDEFDNLGNQRSTVILHSTTGEGYEGLPLASLSVSVIDDEGPPLVSLEALGTVREGESLTVTARLTGPLTAPVTIPIELVPGTANLGQDLVAPLPQGITIAAGALSGSVDIGTATDIDDNHETFRIRLGSLPNSVSTAQPPEELAVTIVDASEPMVSITALSSSVVEGETARFQVTLQPASVEEGITLNFKVTENLANQALIERGGFDPLPTTRMVTHDVAAGVDQFTLTVTATEDTVSETPGEKLTVEVVNVLNGDRYTPGKPPSAQVTVVDDDDQETTVYLSDAEGWEQPSATTQACVEIEVRGPLPSGGLNVVLTTQPGTAVDTGSNRDYLKPRAPSLNIAAGTRLARYCPYILDDGVDNTMEGDETFTVMATSARAFTADGEFNPRIGRGTATVTILATPPPGATTALASPQSLPEAQDAPPPLPQVSVSPGPGVTEGGAATFTVSASPPPEAPLTVSVTVSQSGDYASPGAAGTRSVTIPASGSVSYSVATVDDSADEADGSVTLAVVLTSGYTAGAAASATVAVADNDDPPPTCTTTDAALLSQVESKVAQHATETGRTDLHEMFSRSLATMKGTDTYTVAELRSRPDKQHANWDRPGPNALWQAVYTELDRLETCRSGG